MAKAKKITDTKTLEEIAGLVHSQDRADIEENLENWDEYNEDTNKNHIFNNIVAPAVDKFYNAFTAKLDELFKGDETKVHNKKKEIQDALGDAIEAYFKEAHPGALKGLDDIKDPDEKYATLTHLYDTIALGLSGNQRASQGVQRLTGFAEAAAKGKKTTVGHLKRNFSNQKNLHIGQIMRSLDSKAADHYVNHIDPKQLAHHLRPTIEKEYDIHDFAAFYQHDNSALLALREGINKGEWGELNAEVLGVTKKTDKKDKHEKEYAGAGHH